MSSDKKSIPIKPVPADNKADNKAEVVSLYAEHKKIHPRHVTGLFANMRVAMVWLTQLVYFGFPWMTWNGRQAVLFDLVNRKFYFFGITFFPQDFIYVAALLMMCALGLFLWTTIAGRLWCGYACPQTVYTEVFLWFEHLIEGDRSKRIKLDAAPMSARKLGLKTAKHTLWIAFSLITGFTLVAYFTPRTMLIDELLVWDLGPWETFWIFFYAFATYGMAGFMREQVCKYMCPYARFQSVMFDADTLIISYDTERGEPRGTRKKGVDPASVGKGSCVDCGICVQVCPTGIDIRNGLQYECIGCAACIDACDEVMDKMNYPRGLIRYTTENALEKHYPESQIWTRIKRPRVVMYSLVLFTVAGIAITGLMMRQPMKVDILRDRASLVRETQDGLLENTYNIRFINISENPQKLKLSVQGLPGIKLVAERDVFDVPPTGNVLVTLNVQAPPESAPKGSHKIQFVIKSLDDNAVNLEEPSSFIGE
ncbi:cytochrome c oxidase accessory protein CcoG [Rivihabitans pingtungensis]|jgi:cytochrome c oxidase accessory protein FixG|uniref:cytochrome c oxidase accessory protein CcoG n=1 Tax=Rivihabitans pingtungensis TaxID=1054498 RepID=UPI0023575554|nr:cytochrome c oxidase accessory protein CcoG [Rivihabitans pingtungensis]MCK6437125.1 cytochrome c oxidase accessory protein CcoG [Rivihabitans pingtungensis]